MQFGSRRVRGKGKALTMFTITSQYSERPCQIIAGVEGPIGRNISDYGGKSP